MNGQKKFDRFTRKSRLGRGKIPKSLKEEVLKRDNYTCLFCNREFDKSELTLDHLIPLSKGGLDEMINYVSCCRECNNRKADTSLHEFASSVNILIEALPVHGDPIIDNVNIPIQIRLIRKKIYDWVRKGEIRASGKSAQKKIEKAFRREFWNTPEGRTLENEFPNLPGHVRVMIPEIQSISNSTREYLLLIELAKSANTRNLIGTVLNDECDIIERIYSLEKKSKNIPLKKRLKQALIRFESEQRRRRL